MSELAVEIPGAHRAPRGAQGTPSFAWLGRILIVGGAGYVLGAFVGYGIAGAESWLVEGLT
ncbi:MAG: hypothetical protein WDZ96_03235 [Acidimicrobiia bacterium]